MKTAHKKSLIWLRSRTLFFTMAEAAEPLLSSFGMDAGMIFWTDLAIS